MKLKIIVAFLICLLLSGCGFRLRGCEPLPLQLHVLYLTGCDPYSPLMKRLRQVFRSLRVCLVNNPCGAFVTLQILSDDFHQTSTSIGTSGEVTTYLVTYCVSYQLRDSNGRILQGPQSVTTTRSYSISSSHILGDTAALDSLQEEMQRDVIYQLLTQLRSVCTARALQQLCTY